MPIGIDGRLLAGFIERSYLHRGQIPPRGAKILPQLFLISRADNH
jgi:hypothetical protein